MAWNNGKERKKFEKEQAELRKIYLANGMTEEQIQAMYNFDLEYLHSRRSEATHTQSLDFDSIEFDDKETDNPLFQKFMEKMSVEIDCSYIGRFSWIEEIGNEKLAKAIKKLNTEDLELLTEWYIEGLTQKEIARRFNVKQGTISKKITALKKFFEENL
ncbi:MAG: hypothetical protein J6A63_08915 [Clostridia bacterium]|nr:hypothetical protein [Clostridia bacterium]